MKIDFTKGRNVEVVRDGVVVKMNVQIVATKDLVVSFEKTITSFEVDSNGEYHSLPKPIEVVLPTIIDLSTGTKTSARRTYYSDSECKNLIALEVWTPLPQQE